MGAGKEAQQVKVFATQTWSSEKGGERIYSQSCPLTSIHPTHYIHKVKKIWKK